MKINQDVQPGMRRLEDHMEVESSPLRRLSIESTQEDVALAAHGKGDSVVGWSTTLPLGHWPLDD